VQKSEKNSFGRFGVFFEKNGLGPLGVNPKWDFQANLFFPFVFNFCNVKCNTKIFHN
jgi:hypothetical protein